MCRHDSAFEIWRHTNMQLQKPYIKKGKKVKLSLCLTKHHTMKTYWEWRYSSTHSLTSALDGSEWSASRPARFTPRERAPSTHWIGSWVSPTIVLDRVVKRKIPSLRRESNPDHLACS
jgi:hypothetical protein